jgi:ribosome-binding factor A
VYAEVVVVNKRVARVNEQMKRELIALLRYDVRDPRVGAVTVTDVETAPDLYHAKVYVSIPGDVEERDRALEGLRAASGFLRGEIGRRMHIRRAPELHFTLDETLRHAMHIEQLLREARAGSSGADDVEDDELEDEALDDGELEIEVELEEDWPDEDEPRRDD